MAFGVNGEHMSERIEVKLAHLARGTREVVEHYMAWAKEKFPAAFEEFEDLIRSAVLEQVQEELRLVHEEQTCPHVECLGKRMERRMNALMLDFTSAAPVELVQKLKGMLDFTIDWSVTSTRKDVTADITIVVRPQWGRVPYVLSAFDGLLDGMVVSSDAAGVAIEGTWQGQAIFVDLFYAALQEEEEPSRPRIDPGALN